jgi:ubiquinone biosynthesis protein
VRFISTAAGIGQAFKNAGRVREIATVFFAHGFADLLHRMRLTRFLPDKVSTRSRYQDIPLPMRLRSCFEELGPTFVKLGQLLASRPDLIPAEFVAEFELLQDKVAFTPLGEIRAFLETELKRPIEEVFETFESTPIAAASIGQVFDARLRDGRRVAVKVQRPGIERTIQNDVSIMRGVALLLERYIPESRPFNPTGLVEEFFKTILQELDFRVEANNTRRIKANLASLEKVHVPAVYQEWSSQRVLVLEFLQGTRFSDREKLIAAGINPLEIVEIGGDAFFHMVMRDGLFHADLHAGNLLILEDGRIGFLDFGIVGRLSRRVQDSIITMFLAIVDEDYETLASEYLTLCQSSGPTDLSRLQKDLMDTISPYVGMALGEVNVGQLLLQSTSIAVRHNLQVPRELMLLFKAILNIESLGKQLEPTFDILQVGQRLARQALAIRYNRERVTHDLIMLARDLQNVLEPLPKLTRRFLRTWSQNGFAFETRNRDLAQLAGSVRLLARSLSYLGLTIGLFALGIALLILDKGPWVLGLSVPAALALGGGVWVTGYGLWTMRRYR